MPSAGGDPGRWSVGFVLLAAVVIAAGGTAQPDCSRWQHFDYFDTATEEEVVECLSAGANPDVRGLFSETRLHSAASATGSPAVIEALLLAGAHINARDWSGRTPLHWAARLNENPVPAAVEALLAAGAFLHARDRTGETPLHSAAMYNENPAVIEVLLGAGADIHARDRFGLTPLYNAATNENLAVTETLLAAGARINALSVHDWVPLHQAARANENPAVAEALLAAGARINALTDDDQTPLHQAAGFNENPAMIEVLLAAGARINAQADDGRTPLHEAARINENPAVIEALLAAGADPSLRDADGERPGDLASRNNALQGTDAYRKLRQQPVDKVGRAPGPARRPADKARIGSHFRAYSDRFATQSEAFSRDVIADPLPSCFVHGLPGAVSVRRTSPNAGGGPGSRNLGSAPPKGARVPSRPLPSGR